MLSALVPKLVSEVAKYYPDKNGLPPDDNPPRDYFVFYAMRALAYQQVEEALDPLVRIMLEPNLQRERYDEQSGRDFPPNWPVQAREALRHYDPTAVAKAIRGVSADMERNGALAELTPMHVFRMLSAWRSSAWRGRRLHAFALEFCDLLDRLPFEGEPGVARMLATGAQARYVEAAKAGRAAAARKRARGFDPADDRWTPRRIEGRAAIYEALSKKQVAECAPQLGDDAYLLWIVGIYERFILMDADAAKDPTVKAWRGSAWLDRDVRNLRADLLTVAGKAEDALRLLDPPARLPIEARQGEGWYRFYFARALAANGQVSRAKGELAEALRINRRLIANAKLDPLLKGYDDVFEQADEDFFDRLFSD
jgi:hypothetical protein